MLKVNKSTHLIILSVLSMVFVMVYLYFMIQDIKRLDVVIKKITDETGKITQDIQNLVTTISNLNKDMTSLKKPAMVAAIVGGGGACGAGEGCEAGEGADCADSVITEDIQNILGDEDSEGGEGAPAGEGPDGPEGLECPDGPAATLEPIPETMEDTLKSKKYDELKDLCKSKGISAKGSRETLVIKLLQTMCT
jgi:hypothetical protein